MAVEVEVPPDVARVAGELSLGELDDRYQPSTSTVPFLAEGMAASSLGLFGILIAASGISSGKVGVAVPIATALLAAAAFVVLRAVRTRRNRAFYLYRGGVVATDSAGRISLSARWEDIELYWQTIRYIVNGIDTGVRDHYQLAADGVIKLRFAEREDRGPGRRLRALAAASKLPDVLNRINSGESVRFGPLTASKQGLIYRGMTLPWWRILPMTHAPGKIVIQPIGAPAVTLSTKDVPDIIVLENLVRHASANMAWRAASG